MNVGNYRKAIAIFEAFAGQVPVQPVCHADSARTRARLLQGRRTEQAIDAADTFLRENPTHARVDYATYVKGLAYFERGQTFLERLFRKRVDGGRRATASWHLRPFARLVERYPASEYSPMQSSAWYTCVIALPHTRMRLPGSTWNATPTLRH